MPGIENLAPVADEHEQHFLALLKALDTEYLRRQYKTPEEILRYIGLLLLRVVELEPSCAVHILLDLRFIKNNLERALQLVAGVMGLV
jgi:hypothetical protein